MGEFVKQSTKENSVSMDQKFVGTASKQSPKYTITSDDTPIQMNKQEDEYLNESELLDDISSGTGAIANQMEYIVKSIEWAEKYNQQIPEGVKQAANEILRITKHFDNNLKKLQEVVSDIKNFKNWLDAQKDFAQKTYNLNLEDGIDALNDWLKSAERSNESSKSYEAAVSSWLAKAGQGSIAFAKLSFVSSALFAYKDVSIAALKAGIKNVKKYQDRHHPDVENDNWHNNIGGNGNDIPNQPLKPLPWVSSEDVKRNKERQERYEEEKRRIEKRNKQIKNFDKNILPKAWLKIRRKIYKKIKKEKDQIPRKFKNHFRSIDNHGKSTNLGKMRYADERLSVFERGYNNNYKQKLTLKEAIEEVTSLRNQKCPYTLEFYNKTLNNYLKQEEENELKNNVSNFVESLIDIF